MGLSLPADLEPFVGDYDELTSAGVYALNLTLPDDFGPVWDARYDVRPEWWDDCTALPNHVYVGGAKNLLRRLEEHRDGEVRKATLVALAADVGLRNVWLMDSAEQAFERES